jgi:hypothetical protein
MKILKRLLDLILYKQDLVENSMNVPERVEALMNEGMSLADASYVADMEEGIDNGKK